MDEEADTRNDAEHDEGEMVHCEGEVDLKTGDGNPCTAGDGEGQRGVGGPHEEPEAQDDERRREREEQRNGRDGGARKLAAEGSVEEEAGEGEKRDEPDKLCIHFGAWARFVRAGATAKSEADPSGMTTNKGKASATATQIPFGNEKRERLVLQEVDLVDVEGLACAEKGNDDGEADGGFGSRYNHDEEDKDLAGYLMPHVRERDEGEVHGVQHELDRHEDRDNVALDEEGGDANAKQDRGEDEVVGDGYHYDLLRRAAMTAITMMMIRSGNQPKTRIG